MIDEVISIAPLSFKGVLVAILCGLLIGFERQWSGKPAGIRTSIIITLSAYAFVSMGHYLQPEEGTVRIIGQIVTGVGFLGAGVILSREGLVMGVTSATVIWMLTTIGCLIGLGSYGAAILLAVIALAVLVGITYLEKVTKKLKRGVHNDRFDS